MENFANTIPSMRKWNRLPLCIWMWKPEAVSNRYSPKGANSLNKGDLILRFSNASLQRNSIDTETRLFDTLDIQRNTQFTREQNTLVQKENLLNLNYQISDLERKFKRYQALGENPSVISEEELQSVRDELTYKKNQRDLLEERIRQEERLTQIQLEQANKSIKRLNTSLDLLAKTVESLEIRAPISGYLSSIDAEVGQNIGPGKRIGQIDLLDKLKLRAGIDQYYIAKVTVGTKGKFTLEGNAYEVAVEKIYPEVKDDKITVDLAFVGRNAARDQARTNADHRAGFQRIGKKPCGSQRRFLQPDKWPLGVPAVGRPPLCPSSQYPHGPTKSARGRSPGGVAGRRLDHYVGVRFVQ